MKSYSWDNRKSLIREFQPNPEAEYSPSYHRSITGTYVSCEPDCPSGASSKMHCWGLTSWHFAEHMALNSVVAAFNQAAISIALSNYGVHPYRSPSPMIKVELEKKSDRDWHDGVELSNSLDQHGNGSEQSWKQAPNSSDPTGSSPRQLSKALNQAVIPLKDPVFRTFNRS